MRRRRDLLAYLAGSLLGACQKSPRADADEGPPEPTPTGRWRELAFRPGQGGPEEQAALLFEPSSDAPVVVALHGRGEASRGLLGGARGFRDDYGLERVHEVLQRGTVEASDLGGWLTEERKRALDASLRAAPFRGVALATPYTPALGDRSLEGARGFARFVVGRLLPEVERRLGERPRERTGLDGISMGGRLALHLACLHPERFGSVGALQPAIAVGEAERFARAIAAAFKRAPFRLRLGSSEDDPFLEPVRALGRALTAEGVAHQLVVTPGPHDYAWNRGPGAAELLMFHERVLRDLPPP